MKRFYLDTSSSYLSFVLTDCDGVIFSTKIRIERGTSEKILPILDFMLTQTSMDIALIDEYYVITGPGTFTGIRVGISFVYGLAIAGNKTVYGINSLDAKAISIQNDNDDEFSIVSRLKGDLFAIRSYNFKDTNFSNIEEITISDGLIGDYITVNSFKTDVVNLEAVAKSENISHFLGECLPLYLRKAEAEIDFDKSCNIR